MADVLRWRYGETGPVQIAVDSAQVIEIGDLIYLNTDDGRPASQLSFAGGLATSQERFVDDFLGVAMQRSRSGDTAPIRVATGGVFEFITASDTFELGDLIGVAANSGVTALEDQTVASIADGHKSILVSRAIGRAAKTEASATTSVLVEIRSTVRTGGYQVGTASV